MGIKDYYTKQEVPFYVWKFNIDGTITKYIVDHYRVAKFFSGDNYLFMLEGSSNGHSIKKNQMDRFVSNRYCSFTNDDKKAFKAIEGALMAKSNKLKDDYERTERLLQLLRDNN